MIRLKNYKKNTLVCLQKTRRITKDDLIHQEWKELKEEYNKIEDSIDKALASIINSILYQRRKSFVITRRNLHELIREDRNHKDKTTFGNNLYTTILAAAHNGLFEIAHKRESSNGVEVYRLTDEYLLSCLDGVDMNCQVKQSIDFARKVDSKKQFEYHPITLNTTLGTALETASETAHETASETKLVC